MISLRRGARSLRAFLSRKISPDVLKIGVSPRIFHPQPDARDAFVLLYTSGTTASPKAVPHPFRTLLGNSRMGAREHGLTAASRVLCAAPLSHLYGLYSLHCAWSVGACTVLLPAFKPEELATAVQRDRPTALWCGPAHLAACRNAGLFDSHDWSSLRLAA